MIYWRFWMFWNIINTCVFLNYSRCGQIILRFNIFRAQMIGTFIYIFGAYVALSPIGLPLALPNTHRLSLFINNIININLPVYPIIILLYYGIVRSITIMSSAADGQPFISLSQWQMIHKPAMMYQKHYVSLSPSNKVQHLWRAYCTWNLPIVINLVCLCSRK